MGRPQIPSRLSHRSLGTRLLRAKMRKTAAATTGGGVGRKSAALTGRCGSSLLDYKCHVLWLRHISCVTSCRLRYGQMSVVRDIAVRSFSKDMYSVTDMR
jgi:hypothetical protein